MILFVNVYLPCASTIDSMDSTKDILDEIIDICIGIEHEYLIFGGDLNCDLNIVSKRSLLILTRLSQLGLSLCKLSPSIMDGVAVSIYFTHSQAKLEDYSCTDHFYIRLVQIRGLFPIYLSQLLITLKTSRIIYQSIYKFLLVQICLTVC